MRAAGPGSGKSVLPGDRGNNDEPAADAAARRGVHQASILRQSSSNEVAEPPGQGSQPQACATAHAADGPGSDLSQASVECRRSQPPSVSVLTAWRSHRTCESGVECGYHVRADAEGVYVPGGDHRLVQSLCGVLAVIEHAGWFVLP